MLQNDNLDKYIEAITGEAKTAERAVEEKIEQYKSEKLGKVKADAEAEAEAYVKKQCDLIIEDIGREFSEKELQIRKTVFEKRDEIRKDIFDKVFERVYEFSQSAQYESFLENSINNIKSNLFGRDKTVKVYIRECDLKYKPLIEKSMVFPCELIIDEKNKLGGIWVKFARLIINDTLETRILEQIRWFEENSGLTI